MKGCFYFDDIPATGKSPNPQTGMPALRGAGLPACGLGGLSSPHATRAPQSAADDILSIPPARHSGTGAGMRGLDLACSSPPYFCRRRGDESQFFRLVQEQIESPYVV